MRSRHYALLFTLALCLVPATLPAQVDTGTIVGTVKDSTGGVLPDAVVVVTNVGTGTKTTLRTGPDGTFVATPLKIGGYAISVEAQGFKTETRKNIVLQVQDRLRVDFELQVGDIKDQVVVEDAPPLLQTETSSLGDVISSSQVTSLPLNGRDYTLLATLTAGVSRTDLGDNGNNGGSFASNGARATLNNFLLDGIDNNSNDNGRNVLQTSVDAIAEFKVQTNSYSAEFGRSGGAVINATIKSGSNDFHGSVFEFLRNSALDARDYFADPNSSKPLFQLNQFGGTIGGPIIRNKTFFFADYQGSILNDGQTIISTVPMPAERNGDFSGSGVNIYDPATTDAANGNARQQFTNNQIPASRFDPVAKAFMDLYPDPNVAGAVRNNYITTGKFTDKVHSTNLRLDHSFSQNNQLFGRFAYNKQHTETPAPLPGLANGGGSRTGDTFINAEGVSIGDTHTLNPSTINELRIGFTRLKEDRGLPFDGQNFPAAALRVPGVPDNPTTNGLAALQPGGYRRVGDPSFSPTLITTYESQLSDTLSMIRGTHTIKFGVQLRRSQFNIFQVNAPRGRLSFNGRFTRDPVSGDGGQALADMLLGLTNTARLSSLSDLGNRQASYGTFIMDDWKATPHLTLNLGLRYDYTQPIVEVHDEQANLDFATGEIIVPDLSKITDPGKFKFKQGKNRGLVDGDKLNFAPRVGFAWTPFAGGKMVIRGGYGIYYSAQEYRTAGGNQLAYNHTLLRRIGLQQRRQQQRREDQGQHRIPAAGPLAGRGRRGRLRRLPPQVALLSALESQHPAADPLGGDPRSGIRRIQRHASAGRHRPESGPQASHWERRARPALPAVRPIPQFRKPRELQLPRPPDEGDQAPLPGTRLPERLHLREGHRRPGTGLLFLPLPAGQHEHQRGTGSFRLRPADPVRDQLQLRPPVRHRARPCLQQPGRGCPPGWLVVRRHHHVQLGIPVHAPLAGRLVPHLFGVQPAQPHG